MLKFAECAVVCVGSRGGLVLVCRRGVAKLCSGVPRVVTGKHGPLYLGLTLLCLCTSIGTSRKLRGVVGLVRAYIPPTTQANIGISQNMHEMLCISPLHI